MSMILYLRRADDFQLAALKELLAAPTPAAVQAPGKSSFLSKLFGGKVTAPSSPPVSATGGSPTQGFFFAPPESEDVIDFDRAWDALNMMLTGEPFGVTGPLAIFYYKGEEIGPDDGYGPARYIPADAMRSFANALQNLSDHDLASRFDPAAFQAAQLYSSYLFSEDGVEVDYVMQGVPKLRKFAYRCVETGSGALVAVY